LYEPASEFEAAYNRSGFKSDYNLYLCERTSLLCARTGGVTRFACRVSQIGACSEGGCAIL